MINTVKIKKKVNIIKQNICKIPDCDCGANIELGFSSREDFYEFMGDLKKKYKVVKINKS